MGSGLKFKVKGGVGSVVQSIFRISQIQYRALLLYEPRGSGLKFKVKA